MKDDKIKIDIPISLKKPPANVVEAVELEPQELNIDDSANAKHR